MRKDFARRESIIAKMFAASKVRYSRDRIEGSLNCFNESLISIDDGIFSSVLGEPASYSSMVLTA